MTTAADLTVAEVAAGVPLDLVLGADGTPSQPVVFVDLAGSGALGAAARDAAATALREALPITVGVASAGEDIPPVLLDALSLTVAVAPVAPVDRRVVSGADARDGTLAELVGRLRVAIAAAPRAAVTLGRLLRQTAVLDVADGLAAESAAYSTLLAGPEFARWLAARGPARSRVPGHVRVVRSGDVVRIELDRVTRRNAVDTATRDALADALGLLADPGVRIELTAAGPDFCAGGDLDEFGTAPDPVTAYVVRLEQSAGRRIARDAQRVTAYVHGACVGAGCEIPAFAGRVVAAPDAWFALPELALGLVPGAGGTVSVTRRIGRWRTAWMALTGAPVAVSTAAAWGLVDVLADGAPHHAAASRGKEAVGG